MEIIDKQNKASLEEYEAFVSTHRAGSFMQSLRWTKVKNNWDYAALLSRDDAGKIRGAMLLLIQKIPMFGCTFLYAPRGPVCELHNEEVLLDLLDGVRAVAKSKNAYLFRMDPYILNDDTAFIKMATERLGCSFTPEMKDFTTIQTRNNYMLDIEGKTLEELLASFHSKWRYNIHLAQRKGVQVRYCGGDNPGMLDDFYRLMQVTGLRDGFIIRPKAYFKRMLDALGPHARLYVCYYDGHAVSGALTSQYAGKTSYIYGASDNNYRNVMPNHLMQWEMIKWAVENGDFVYDFQGIPGYQDENDPNYGIYRFKKGFNGQVVTFAGEFDIVFKPLRYRMIEFAEKANRRLKKVKRRIGEIGKDAGRHHG